MTRYKTDTSVRILIDSSKIPELADAYRFNLTQEEALRRLVQGWFEDQVLPVIKASAAETFRGAASVFDNANTKVELD